MLRIVLLDDERVVLRGISALIKREENYELVGTAENGIDGLELIRNTRPDIVMTDIRMPGMSGLDMIRKAKEAVPESVYIVFSGFNEFKYVKEAIGLGVIDYIEKPVTVPKLQEVLKKAYDICNYQKNYSEMTRNLKKTERVYIEKYLRDLYEHPQEKKELLQRLIEKNPRLKNMYSLCVVKICEEKSKSIDDYREVIQLLTFAMIGDESVEVYSFYERESLVLVYFNTGETEFPFNEKIENVKKNADLNARKFLLGISQEHKKLYSINEAFEEADNALKCVQDLNMAERSEDVSCRAIREVKSFVEEHYAEGISLDDAAEKVHMSTTYLSMLFKKEEGVTYIKYLTKVRMEKAMSLLKQGYKANRVCEMVGYHDYKYFSMQFKKYTGMTLDTYKKSL